MKLFSTILILCCCVASLYGQNLARKVSFSYNRLALKLVLDDISADHDVYFVYSPDYIPTSQPITISVNNIALSEALDKLFDPLPVAYKSIGGQIVLRPVEKNPPPRITNKTIPKEVDQQSPLYADPRMEEIIAERKKRWAQSSPTISGRPAPQKLPSNTESKSLENLTATRFDPLVIDSTLLMEEEVAAAPVPNSDSTTDSTSVVINPKKNLPRLAQISLLPFLGSNFVQSARTTNRVSVNLLWGHNGGVEGLEIGGLMNSIRNDVQGIQIAGLGNTVGDDVLGTQAAGLFNIATDTMVGVQGAGLFNILGRGSALQGAGLFNIARHDFAGVQAAGLFNIAGKNSRAVQVGGLFNVSGGRTRLQVSPLFNIAKDVNNGQLSTIINVARQVKGVQIGLINVADTVSGVTIGLLNLVRKGYNRVELSTSESFLGNLAFKIGVKPFYNIFYLGARISEAQNPGNNTEESIKELTWGLGYGFGTAFSLGKRTLSNLELISIKVNEREGWTRPLHQLHQVRLLFDWRLGKRMSIYAGPTANLLVSSRKDPELGIGGSELVAKTTLYDKTDANKRSQGWIGFNAGIRL
ncbi:MAG: STN domain-containing protein [Haliscomenobacter sp.]|uniref:STN domain-containing protein n=1 Tax=Haliscomenobacter sp. TaxID=2717303 RepID=UPI0029B1D1A8|nr:STN domain-containing protein [Haliscomenobacter sp.]MDX2069199.1 STN domain-containing protein [Haliscomenobacter sp.]